LMLELGRHVGRQDAHDIVYEVSEQAFAPGSNFSQLLAADSRITEHLSTTQIDALLDPTLYTGQCALLADEQAALARSKASAIRAR
jgi:3-carboxy-cis,cis-muconate cycloisomerase